MKILTVILTAALACGCATDPGHVSSTTTKLDGERQVSVVPAYLHGKGLSSPARLGGFWSSHSPEVFTLEVMTDDYQMVTGLRVGIDGRIQDFEPSSVRRFVVPLKFVEEMIAA